MEYENVSWVGDKYKKAKEKITSVAKAAGKAASGARKAAGVLRKAAKGAGKFASRAGKAAKGAGEIVLKGMNPGLTGASQNLGQPKVW